MSESHPQDGFIGIFNFDKTDRKPLIASLHAKVDDLVITHAASGWPYTVEGTYRGQRFDFCYRSGRAILRLGADFKNPTAIVGEAYGRDSRACLTNEMLEGLFLRLLAELPKAL